jgi:hypothetical protein
MPILLAAALALSLLVVALALTPPTVLPRSFGLTMYERRDSLVFAGLATALSIGIGLLITVAAS